MNRHIQVTEGKNGGLRYLSSVLLASLFTILGSFIYVIVEFIIVEGGKSNKTYSDFKDKVSMNITPNLDFLLSHIIYLFGILGIYLSIRFIHKRSIKSLITSKNKINWRKIIWGFSVFASLLVITQLVDFLLNPSDYQWNNVKLTQYIPLLLITLFLVPIQTTTEEIFFRGLLMQWLGKIIINPFILALIVGIIFAACHFTNPEMNQAAILVGLDYILVGFFLTFISVKTKSLEFTIGAHAANNMFLSLFVVSDNSALGSIPSLFKLVKDEPLATLIWSIITFIIFYILCMREIRREERNHPNKLII